MIDTEYCQTLAAYSTWMNQKLYDTCAKLTDADRKEDRGAFFGSIHQTLNHILYADLAFMSRFTGNPAQEPEFGVELHSDFEVLTDARRALDSRISTWSETITPDWLRQSLTYTSKADGVTRTVVHWVLVTHLFNHGTHHRGQITTLLAQLGLDPGATDLPFMPQFQTAQG